MIKLKILGAPEQNSVAWASRRPGLWTSNYNHNTFLQNFLLHISNITESVQLSVVRQSTFSNLILLEDSMVIQMYNTCSVKQQNIQSKHQRNVCYERFPDVYQSTSLN